MIYYLENEVEEAINNINKDRNFSDFGIFCFIYEVWTNSKGVTELMLMVKNKNTRIYISDQDRGNIENLIREKVDDLLR